MAASVKAPRKQHRGHPAGLRLGAADLDPGKALANLEPPEWAVAWRLTLCGLRRSEVLGLRWEAVDLERGEITVRAGRVLLGDGRTATDDPKSTASRRTVPAEAIQPGTVARLRALKAHQGPSESEPVVSTGRDPRSSCLKAALGAAAQGGVMTSRSGHV